MDTDIEHKYADKRNQPWKIAMIHSKTFFDINYYLILQEYIFTVDDQNIEVIHTFSSFLYIDLMGLIEDLLTYEGIQSWIWHHFYLPFTIILR